MKESFFPAKMSPRSRTSRKGKRERHHGEKEGSGIITPAGRGSAHHFSEGEATDITMEQRGERATIIPKKKRISLGRVSMIC